MHSAPGLIESESQNRRAAEGTAYPSSLGGPGREGLHRGKYRDGRMRKFFRRRDDSAAGGKGAGQRNFYVNG